MKIYVNFKKPETIEEFLTLFFSDNLNKAYAFPLPTYLDEECTQLQCEGRKNRSFEEVFDLIKTYYPKTTIETLLLVLVKLRPQQCYLYCASCSSINRITIVYYYSQIVNYNLPGMTDPAGYNWPQLLAKIGIYTVKELNGYA